MKVSILDQFAADAINAPAVVTGGSGCKPKKSKSKKCKKSKSKKSKSSKSRPPACPPPPRW
ncbi:MAG: hypothetical protein ABMA01_09005 [Chthoniobacteraceae bacterium]